MPLETAAPDEAASAAADSGPAQMRTPASSVWPAAALGAVAAFSALLLVRFGSREYLGYDSLWHVFIARQESWPNFWREVQDNAHPPLFYLLLKLAVEALGTSLLVYRAVSIGAIVVATILVGRIAKTVTGSGWWGVVAGAAFGLSSNAIEIGLEVRAYAVAVALLLVAFGAYLGWLRTPPERSALREQALFSVALTAAVVTHYSAFFFLAAATSALGVLCCCERSWRARAALEWKVARRRMATGLMFGVPALAAVISYTIHVKLWVQRFNHLPGFLYESGNESILEFVVRTAGSLVLLMSPDVGDGATWLALAVGLVAGAVWLATRRVFRASLAMVVFVVLAVMVLLNLFAALAGRYPFGGHLRHEIFLFPFVTIALFAGIESVRRLVPLRAASLGLWVGATSACVVASCCLWMSSHRVRSTGLFQVQMDTFRQAFGTSRATLVDQFNLIGLFGHYHDWKWKLTWQSRDRDPWQVWDVSKGEERFQLCRSRQWLLNLSRPATFSGVAECVDRVGAVAIFRPQQSAFAPSWDTAASEQLANELGPPLGIRPDAVLVDGNDVYVSFVPIDFPDGEYAILVVEATYGGNCGADRGNATASMGGACDGRTGCVFRVDVAELGDPVQGCKKDFRFAWECGQEGGLRKGSVAPEAGFGRIALLRCDPRVPN
ncbi:MAG TPA: hypothetical protein VNB06_16715 [Thermoanaerobaculia bacterium]|nr:hypothetical protein [Thermoanaerobaculia bacterium]